MVRSSIFKPLGIAVSVIGLVLLLAACAPIQPAAAPAAAAATATAPAAEAMTTTQTTTATESMSGTTAMTTTEEMTGTETTTATEETTGTETTTATESMSGTAGLTLMVYNSPTLGPILTDDKGMTLYIFDKDVKDKSNCSGGCLKNWPPLTVKDEDTKVTGDGVTATFGVIEGADGTYQVTANGMPLYYYIKDQKANDTVGQAVGDVWWVVAPDGSKVTKK